MKVLYWICLIIVLIGGLNWGLIGFFNFNLVAFLFGEMMLLTKVIYAVVGVSAVIMVIIKLVPGGCCCKHKQ